MLKTVSLLALFACVAAPRLVSQLPKECDKRPAHALTYRPIEATSEAGSVTGTVVDRATRHPLFDVMVMVSGDSIQVAETDSLGRFSFANVQSGRHTLHVHRDLFVGTSDSLLVPPSGVTVEVAQQQIFDTPGCDFERELARELALTVARTETFRFERDLPEGGRLRHTLLVSGNRDAAEFVSILKNVSSRGVDILQLCYPFAQSSALRFEPAVGPACYGSGNTLQPGDSVIVHTGGRLRGAPGRYHFKVHPIDPALLDAEFELRLNALKPVRKDR
jgi:hypothetical protein